MKRNAIMNDHPSHPCVFALEALEQRQMLSAAVTPIHVHASMIGARPPPAYNPASGYLPAVKGTLPSQIELNFDIARGDDYWIYYTYNYGAAFKHFYGGGSASGKIKVDIPISRLKGNVLSSATVFWDYQGQGSNEGIAYFTVVATPAGQGRPTINRTGKRITGSVAAAWREFCAPQIFFIPGDGQGIGNNNGEGYDAYLDYVTQQAGFGAETHLFTWNDKQIVEQIRGELPPPSVRFPIVLMGSSYGGGTAVNTAWSLADDGVPISAVDLFDLVPPHDQPSQGITIFPPTGPTGFSPDGYYCHIQLPTGGAEANMVADNWFAYDETLNMPTRVQYELCGPIVTADSHFTNWQGPLKMAHNKALGQDGHPPWTPPTPPRQVVCNQVEGLDWKF